jgi:O-methyltransferase involved in polyketide biosynthesis
VVRNKDQLNYILARPATFNYLIHQYIASISPNATPQNATLVEIAAGFSPRGYELALEMPHLQIIEIDLPDVIEEKQQRLAKAHIAIPPNIKWYQADLGVRALSDVLSGEKVDIVSAEGLNPYFPPESITRIASHIRESLKPRGIYISDVGWQYQQDESSEASLRIFRRNASNFFGVIKTEEEGRQLFVDAGYSDIEVYRPTKVTADMADIPRVPQDYSVIFIAHNPASPASSPKSDGGGDTTS